MVQYLRIILRKRSASGLIGVAIVALLVLLDLGLNPFGSVGLDRPWSRCGLTMCACTPEDSLPQPECPLCITGDPGLTSSCDPAGGPACGSMRLVRTAERLGGDLPMLTELLSASLVLRLGGSPITLDPPTACGASCVVFLSAPVSRGIEIEPPPPKV